MRRVFSPIVLALAVLWASPAASRQERHFTSTLGFSLSYPTDWQGGNKGYERFFAAKGPSAPKMPGLEPLSPGQAVVATWELNSPSEIERLIVQIDSDDIQVLKPASRNRRPKGCDEIRQVSSLFEFAPGPRAAPVLERNVHFFCTVGRRAFVTMLRYSESDPAGALHQAAARRMMESLQVETAD